MGINLESSTIICQLKDKWDPPIQEINRIKVYPLWSWWPPATPYCKVIRVEYAYNHIQVTPVYNKQR